MDDAKGLFGDDNEEQDALFQPVKLNRKQEQHQAMRSNKDQTQSRARQHAMNASQQESLQMFYQESEQQDQRGSMNEIKDFDDILEQFDDHEEKENLKGKHSNIRSGTITAGQMLDDDLDFQENIKNFSFNGKQLKGKHEQLLHKETQELLLLKKHSFGPSFEPVIKSSKRSVSRSNDDFDIDSSLNNRVSDSLENSLKDPRMSIAGSGAGQLFNNTSINEDKKSNSNEIKKSPHFKSKNSSGKSKQINQSNPSTGGSKDQSSKIKSVLNSGGSKDQSQKIKSILEQPGEAGVFSPSQRVQARLHAHKIEPKDIYHDFLNQKESPDLIRETDSDREHDEVAQVMPRGRRDLMTKHKQNYLNNYHSHRPSLAGEKFQDDEQVDQMTDQSIRASNIGVEGDIISPNKVRKHTKTLSHQFGTNDKVLRKIKITPTHRLRKISDLKEGGNKLVIRKSSINMVKDPKTPEKKNDMLSLQVPGSNYETSQKQKGRMLLKSFAEKNQHAYQTEKKPQTATSIKSRLVQQPQLFVSKQNLVENDNTSPTDNETPLFKQQINNTNRFGSKKNSQASVFDQVPMMQKYETLQNPTQGHMDLSGVSQINSLKELLGVFGVSLQDNNTFEYQGRDYKINLNEIVQNQQSNDLFNSNNKLIIRRHGLNRLNRSSISSQHNSSLMVVKDSEPLNPLNQTEILPSLNEEHDTRFHNLRSNTPNAIGGIGRYVPDLNLGERMSKSPFLEPISKKDGNQNPITRSQNNLLLPPSGKTNPLKDCSSINNPSEKFAQAQLMTNLKSQRSGLSSYSKRSDKSKHSQKSQIVSSHELQAERQRRKNRKNSQNKSIGFRKDYSPLQIERQNQTDYNQVNNQLHVKQEIKPNLSQQQLILHNKFLLSKKSENTNSGNASSQLQIENYTTAGNVPQLQQRMSESQGDMPLNNSNNYMRINSVENPVDSLSDYNQQPPVSTAECIKYEQIHETTIHLAFLFASPLMLKTSESNVFNSPLPPISFSEEFEQIRTCFEEKSMAINYTYHVATQKNLLNALRQNPIGLHFSGHGFQNTEKLYNHDSKAWAKYKNKGDVLIFENESGASEFFFTSDLKEMFQEIKHSLSNPENEGANIVTHLQFVYVASCHSEQVGKVFQEAGVPHVICINQKETILDKAAVEFSKFFYDEVFDRYNSICDAFEFAKKRVEDKYGKHHAKKLLLLLNSETHGEKCQNDKQRTHLKGQGQPQQIGQFTELVFLPNKVSSLLFRNQDTYDVLQLLSDERTNIVQIWGMPGLGKSSLLKNCTCYLSERDIYKDGIIYIDFMHVSSFPEIIQIFNAYLKDANLAECIEPQDEPLDSDQDSDDEDYQENMLKLKISSFQKKILFALDNIEHLIGTHHTKLLQFIGDIAEKNVKVLFSSSKYDAKNLPDGVLQVKKILKMSKKESVQLFIKKIPLVERDKQNFLDYSNIEALHKVTIDMYGEQFCSKLKLCEKKRHEHNEKCIIDYLQEHVLFDFFAGIPLVISIVASMSVEQSLAEIFKYMAEQHGEHLKEDLKDKIDDKGLIMCLEYCTNYFTEKKDSSALNLWYLIGTQGPGILYDDLSEIMSAAYNDLDDKLLTEEDKDIEESKTILPPISRLDKNLEDLIQFSLIEEERLDKAGKLRRFRVSPFVDQYVNNKLNLSLKKEKLTSVCMHINVKLKQFKDEYSEATKSCKSKADFESAQNDILEQIRPYEQQILHIVYTLFKLIEEEKNILEQSNADTLNQIDEEAENEDKMTEKDQATDQRISQISFSVLSQQQKRKSKGNRKRSERVQPDEMVPVVSQFIKEARSSIVLKKEEVKEMLSDFSGNSRQYHRLTTVKNGIKHESLVNSKSFKQSDMPNPMFDSLQQIEKTKSNHSPLPSFQSRNEKASFQRAPVYDNPREHQQNLAFIDAKENYLQDFMQERNSLLLGNTEQETKREEDNNQSDSSDILEERDQFFDVYLNDQSLNTTSNGPVGITRKELELFSQKSSDGGPFQLNISEITNQMNPNSEKDTQASSFDYHLRRKNTIIPPRRDELTAKERQSMHLKKLHQIKDQSKMVEVYQNFRNSIYINSMSKDKNGLLKQLQSFQFNPDLIRSPVMPEGLDLEQEIRKINPNRPTDVIDSFIRSAPPKMETNKLTESMQKTHYEMQEHEELFYNYLSILAMIPEKHTEFLNILNNYGQRRDQGQSATRETEQQVFNPVTQAEKKLKKDMTIVEIPDEAVLLLANTKLLELYVCIQQNDDSSEKNILNKKKKIDHITEFAEEIGQFFMKIGFKRGVAIISYIQAVRQYKQFRKLSVFKRLIKQSSLLYFQTYELDGIEQCLIYSEKVLRFDSSKQIKPDITSIQNNEQFIEDISKIQTTLENQADQNVKNFVQFRSDMTVKKLDCKLVYEHNNKSASDSIANSSTNANEQKVTLKSDLIMNMMLNPQHQLQRVPLY